MNCARCNAMMVFTRWGTQICLECEFKPADQDTPPELETEDDVEL